MRLGAAAENPVGGDMNINMVNGIGGGVMAGGQQESLVVRRQRSTKFSLYPGRPRTASKSSSTALPSPVSPIAPQIPPLPLSSRDSLPMHQQTPFTSHHAGTGGEGARVTSNPSQNPNLHKIPSEASRLRALNNGYRSHSSEPTPVAERQVSELVSSVENFSRPRQPSIRRRKESPSPLIHNAATVPLQSHNEEQAPTDLLNSRDRGFSTSSSNSATQIPSYTLRPSMSIPDYQAADSIYTRQRNLNNSTYRPSRGLSRPDSNSSGYRREPIPRPTGFDSEEVRASFRSALTTNSSFLGTSGTERSSVMTKSSSATSIYGKDEGMSVDDAIGMYELGFTDSGVEDNYGPDTRPGTSMSEKKRISGLEEAMNDTLLLPPPKALSNIQIRDSTSIFKFKGTDTPSVHESSGQSLDVQEGYFDREPSSRPATRSPAQGFDDTRDRYGFRKNTQYVPLAQYEAWNGPYTEYIARRRKKWVALMKDSGLLLENPQLFPPRSARVKRFVRKGIPPEWRGAAWFFYAGGPAMVAKHPGRYADLVGRAGAGGVSETDDEIIERDLHRTFPDNVRFKPDPPPGEHRESNHVDLETPILQSLRRVLQAFAIYNPRIGYCQSLNFLAGLLLLFMEEEKSFWMLNIITRVYLPGTHELNLEGANVDLGVLMSAIKDMMPQIWAKIGGELDGSVSSVSQSSLRLPPITLCTTAWFMSCFIGTLPIESTLRVWDSFFLEGSKTLFRIALTIFKLGEVEIKAVSDPMEIFQVVQGIPRKLVDCNELMETCFFKRRKGFGHLSQEAIEEARAERRRGYAEEREKLAADMQPTTHGLIRKTTVRKTGTLFGRKSRSSRTAVEV